MLINITKIKKVLGIYKVPEDQYTLDITYDDGEVVSIKFDKKKEAANFYNKIRNCGA